MDEICYLPGTIPNKEIAVTPMLELVPGNYKKNPNTEIIDDIPLWE